MKELSLAINIGYEELVEKHLSKSLKSMEGTAELLMTLCKKLEDSIPTERDIMLMQQYYLTFYNLQREMYEIHDKIYQNCSACNCTTLKGLESHRKLGWFLYQLKSHMLPLDPSMLHLYVSENDQENKNTDIIKLQMRSMENKAEALIRCCEEERKGHTTINLTKFRLVDLTEFYDAWKEMLKVRNITFETDIRVRQACVVITDPSRFSDLLDAVLYNSIEELVDPSEQEKKIILRIFELEESALVEIRDNGRKISEERVNSILLRHTACQENEKRQVMNNSLKQFETLCEQLEIKMDFGNQSAESQERAYVRFFLEKEH